MTKGSQSIGDNGATATDPTTVAALIPDPSNRRTHSERNVEMIAASLRSVGAARSIVIDETNEVLAGNGVLQGAARAGISKLKVVEVDGDTVVAVRRRGLTADQKRDLAIYDNRTAELAAWDIEQLKADVNAGLDLKPFFFEDELTALVRGKRAVGRTDPDEIPAERATDIRIGDVFDLGTHRLMCGDCLDPAVVDRLVPPLQPAASVVTSPPYWTGQPYDNKPGAMGGDLGLPGATTDSDSNRAHQQHARR